MSKDRPALAADVDDADDGDENDNDNDYLYNNIILIMNVIIKTL